MYDGKLKLPDVMWNKIIELIKILQLGNYNAINEIVLVRNLGEMYQIRK